MGTVANYAPERALQVFERAGKRLEQEKEEAQDQRDCEMIALGLGIGCILGPLLSEKVILEKDNGALKVDIELLKKMHFLELQTAAHAWELKSCRIRERLGEVVRLIEHHQAQAGKRPPCGALKIDPKPFQKLIDSTSKLESSKLEEHSESPENEAPQEILQEDKGVSMIVSFGAGLPIHSNAFQLVQKQKMDVQSLKQEVSSLRAVNNALLEQKRKIEFFQKESLAKINEQKQNELDPKKIMVKARAIFNTINWGYQVPIDRCGTCESSWPSANYSPFSQKHFHNEARNTHIGKLDKLRLRLTVLLDVLEDEIDPVKSSGKR